MEFEAGWTQAERVVTKSFPRAPIAVRPKGAAADVDRSALVVVELDEARKLVETACMMALEMVLTWRPCQTRCRILFLLSSCECVLYGHYCCRPHIAVITVSPTGLHDVPAFLCIPLGVGRS